VDRTDGPSMEAYVLESYGDALKRRIVPMPKPGKGEILLRVRACGICGTDLKITAGHLDGIVSLPHIQGHEIAGEIAALGSGVSGLSLGDRGAVYFYLPCGICEPCRKGRGNICSNVTRLGFEKPGGFAEYVCVPAWNFCRSETELPFEQLAVLPDALLTSYHAIKTAGALRAGEKVLIVGAGGLGLHAVQFARHLGAAVVVCDPRPGALKGAASLGAELMLPDLNEEARRVLDEWCAGEGVQLVIEGSGDPAAFKQSLSCLGRGGRLVIMGYHTSKPYALESMAMHYNEWSVIGSRVGTREELSEVLRLVEFGAIKPVIDRTLPMAKVNEGLALLQSALILGRIVLTL